MKNKSIILLCTLFISIATSAQITKKSVLNQLDTQSEKYGAIAMKIWNLAEMGYLEEQSSSLLQQTLSNEGFTVKKGVANIPTAFVAEYGSGLPIIAILGEFDALPGLSQQALPEKKSANAEAGHACGHPMKLGGILMLCAGI